jgi:hypothetical protein
LTLPDEKLTADQAASTLFRFFRSNHVIDLRLIFGLAVLVFLIHVGVIVGLFSLAGLIALGTGLSRLQPALNSQPHTRSRLSHRPLLRAPTPPFLPSAISRRRFRFTAQYSPGLIFPLSSDWELSICSLAKSGLFAASVRYST